MNAPAGGKYPTGNCVGILKDHDSFDWLGWTRRVYRRIIPLPDQRINYAVPMVEWLHNTVDGLLFAMRAVILGDGCELIEECRAELDRSRIISDFAIPSPEKCEDA